MKFGCGVRLLLGLSLTAAVGDAAVWLDVPFVKQQKNGCGAASIAMLMRYWARAEGAADPVRIQTELYSPDVEGIRGGDVERYFRENGFTTFVFKGAWADLEPHLAKGRPLMVCLKDGRAPLHYLIVAGADTDRGLVLVNDPARRKLLKLDRTNFEKNWSATGNWTLLAVPEPGR